MFDVIGVGVLVVLVVLFGWLTRRAWRARRLPLKIVGLVLAGVPALAVTLVTALVLVGFYHLNAPHDNPVADVKVAGTPAQIARGARFAQFCAGCHSSSGQAPLNGQNFAEGGPPFGQLYAANLTPIHLRSWSDGEIIRAIREGVAKNGRSLVIMPSRSFHALSDEDVQAIVAYLRAQPDVAPDTPPTQINVMGALMSNIAPLLSAQPPIAGPVIAPPVGPTPAYGQYLSVVVGCTECHGQTFAGGHPSPGGEPPAGPELLYISATWSDADFIKTMRTGVTPTGHQLSEEMPWKDISAFASDDDLRALYAYLGTLAAK